MSRFPVQPNDGRRQVFPNMKSGTVAVPMVTGDEKKEEVVLFGIDLSNLPRSMQFMILTVATFFFYLIYGYLQVNSCSHGNTMYMYEFL